MEQTPDRPHLFQYDKLIKTFFEVRIDILGIKYLTKEEILHFFYL